MTHKICFEPGCYYHIYNHGNGNDNVFRKPENYQYFLRKHDEYMSDAWTLHSWCLMPNHYHLLIKTNTVLNPDLRDQDMNKLIYSRFSHFTNGYAKAINKAFNRRGSLFVKTFKRKLVGDEDYLKQLVCYIHNNPVKDGFTDHPGNWKYSSYKIILEDPGASSSKAILSLFGDVDGFTAAHLFKKIKK